MAKKEIYVFEGYAQELQDLKQLRGVMRTSLKYIQGRIEYIEYRIKKPLDKPNIIEPTPKEK